MTDASLNRFVAAQAESYDLARAEVASGRKRSHWMWFIYPQLRGIGRSPTAQFYGLDGLEEAARYLAHPVLGARLVEMCALILTHDGEAPEEILGEVDAETAKLRHALRRRAGRAGCLRPCPRDIP